MKSIILLAASSISLSGLFGCFSNGEPAGDPDARARNGSRLVDFETSCGRLAGEQFSSAVELLHSFEYPESGRAFRSIVIAHPDCAMARWGIAMSLWHPLWELPRDDDLAAGAAMLAAIDRSSLTPRESAYVDALTIFYTDFNSLAHGLRAEAYAKRMQRVYLDYPADPEAAVLYALALLATADPTDKSYAKQLEAAGILDAVRADQPHHPGVLHYLIHSYDYPRLAQLALDAATIYAGVAPDSAHAQHMPSHIFTRLGLWERSIASNHDSTASAAAYTRRAGLAGHYDEGLHSIDYLMYALLQVARDNEARELLDELRAIGGTNVQNFKVAYTYAASPARYALERRQWAEAAELTPLPSRFPWESFEWARSIHHFARGIGAARSGQLELARPELDVIREIAMSLPATTFPYWREEVFVHIDVLSAWIALGEGDASAALQLAAAAAAREDAVDKHPVTPGEVLPARELFADLLLELGMTTEALVEYEKVLARSRNRANAILGAARAAAGSGRAAVATRYYEALLEQVTAGNLEREGLSEARAYLASNE